MKKGTSYARKERQAITFGYVWRWGSIAMILLIPAIVFGICNLVNIEPQIQGFVTFLSAGIAMFCVGIYDIIGTVLEFRASLKILRTTNRWNLFRHSSQNSFAEDELCTRIFV